MSSSPNFAPRVSTAIVLFGHGSRDPQWRLPIEAVADKIRARQSGAEVRCAYLEMCSPSLPEAAVLLIAGGAREVRIFPMFLGVGKHAREDLPLLIESLRSEHADVIFTLLPTVGEDDRLTDLMAKIALE